MRAALCGLVGGAITTSHSAVYPALNDTLVSGRVFANRDLAAIIEKRIGLHILPLGRLLRDDDRPPSEVFAVDSGEIFIQHSTSLFSSRISVYVQP